MMMIGEINQPNPTVHVPSRNPFDNSTTVMIGEVLAKLQRYLPSNDDDEDSYLSGRESDFTVDSYSCDEFLIYEFKVRRCSRGSSHNWTECPYTHPGDKGRRRDPRKFHYSGTACPDFRKGNCRKGDACEFAHGVFECWLHRARYRTEPCKDGSCCRRRVCFFAHKPEQLRILPQQSPRPPVWPKSYDGSLFRHALDSYLAKASISSPISLISRPMSPPAKSPSMSPNSPCRGRSLGSNSVNEKVTSLLNLQLSKVKSMPSSWGGQIGSGFCSPRASNLRFCNVQEDPVMERVESGRDSRGKIYEKLSKKNLSTEPSHVRHRLRRRRRMLLGYRY